MADNTQDDLLQQMIQASNANDPDAANKILASLAQAPSGQDATPKLADPLMDAAKASRAIQSAPTPPPDFSGMNVGSQMSPDLSTPDSMQSRPMVEGGIPAGAPSQVPSPKIGGLPELIWSLVNPNHRAAGTPQGELAPTKLQSFESFLASFIQSMSAGFANEGHGPGAGLRGAGAAMNAPYQQAVQQFGMQQQASATQAQTEATQAETAQRKAQTAQMGQMVEVRDPVTGQIMRVPFALAQKMAPGIFGAEAKVATAQINQRYKVIPGVGMYDTSSQQMIQGTAKGISVTPEIAQQFKLPQEFIGKPLSISEYQALENGQIRYNGTIREERTVNADGTTSWHQSISRPNMPSAGGTGAKSPAASGGGSPIANIRQGRAPNAPVGSDMVRVMESSKNPLDSAAVDLVEGNRDPSQLSKRGAALEMIMQRAKAYSLAKYGVPYNAAQAAEDYKYATSSQNQNTLKMIHGMTEPGGAIEIAQTAFNAIPGKVPSQTLNKILDGTMSQFGGKSVVGFRTAMLGLADEYSKVMGGGIGSDTGRQQALDIIKESYSKGQGAEAVSIMQQDIAARKKAIIGDNVYLKRQYGVSIVQTSDGQMIDLPTKNLYAAKQRDPKLKVVGEK